MVIPRVDECVSLLAQVDLEQLQAFRKSHPRQAELLAEGEIAGGENDSNATLAHDAVAYRVMTTVAAASIKAARKECQKWLPRLRARLRKAERLSAVSQGLTVVAGASIFTSMAVTFPNGVKVACGLMALGSSICSVWSASLLKPLGQDGTGVFDVYKRLAEVNGRVSVLDLQLIAWTGVPEATAPVDVIAGANETCQLLNELIPHFVE